MNYWAVIDRQKFGPLTLEEIRKMPLREDSYVWHNGLTSWVKASDVPELADLFAASADEVPAVPEESAAPSRPLPPPPPPPAPPVWNNSTVRPPKPPTYLAWSIVSIICCCLLFGIIAVVYAVKVTPLYDQGNYEGARQASEKAEMWLIIAITAGIVAFPFQVILSLV